MQNARICTQGIEGNDHDHGNVQQAIDSLLGALHGTATSCILEIRAACFTSLGFMVVPRLCAEIEAAVQTAGVLLVLFRMTGKW